MLPTMVGWQRKCFSLDRLHSIGHSLAQILHQDHTGFDFFVPISNEVC